MSWDIVLFNSTERIDDLENLDADALQPIDFNVLFEEHFKAIKKDGDHREISGNDYSINYFVHDEPVTNTLLSLYGENGLYELIYLSRKHGWQLFDTGNGEMIDLDDPSKNGYQNFENYVKHVLKS